MPAQREPRPMPPGEGQPKKKPKIKKDMLNRKKGSVASGPLGTWG